MGRRFQQARIVIEPSNRRKISNLLNNDKVLRVRMNQASPGAVVGTCLTMCPAAEIALREREELIHPFEASQETVHLRNPKADPSKMVKAYSRPAAGRVDPLSSDLRPPAVLLSTVRYLLERIVSLQERRWTDVYEYVSDRLRAVRQDLIIQSVIGPAVIKILENTVIFHIYSGYKLCVEPVDVFVPTLNNNQIQENLKWLLSQYQESDSCHDNRVLFESIYLLHNLGNSEALRHYLQLEKPLRCNPLLRTAYRISIGFLLGNYTRVLKLIQSLPSVQCQMAVHRHLVELRRRSLLVMSSGYNSKNLRYPTSKLTELLALDSQQDAINLCRLCGLSVVDAKVQFLKASFKADVEIKPSHAGFIEQRLKCMAVKDLFFTHSGEDIIEKETQPKQGTVKVMTLPYKFRRMKIENE